MSIDTLEDLYLEQLKDIYSANKQALDVTKCPSSEHLAQIGA